jgi:type I restriction enzyme S subunit
MKTGWQVKTLKECCSIARGGSPRPIQDFITTEPDGVNWIKISDATASDRFIFETKEKIKPSGVSRSRLVKDGDFILSNSMSFGRPYIMRTSGCIHDGWLVLADYEKNFDQAFLYYLLGSPLVFNQFNMLAAGSTVRNLNIELASRVVLPVPPLPEQQRIVSILDEVFAGIATATANAEKNLANARELFESCLQSVFENKGEDWEEKSIQELTKVINGYAFASNDFKSTNTIKSIKITNVGVKEFVEETDNYLPESYKETLREFEVREGNIVIALTRTIISTGLKVAVVPQSYDRALLNQRVAALVPNEKIVNKRYLYNFLISDGVKKYVLAHVNTLMQPNLSINDLKNLLVPCPPLNIQQSIVHKLDTLSAETKKLEAIHQRKLKNLEEFKKSILNQAFNGQLQ